MKLYNRVVWLIPVLFWGCQKANDSRPKAMYSYQPSSSYPQKEKLDYVFGQTWILKSAIATPMDAHNLNAYAQNSPYRHEYSESEQFSIQFENKKITVNGKPIGHVTYEPVYLLGEERYSTQISLDSFPEAGIRGIYGMRNSNEDRLHLHHRREDVQTGQQYRVHLTFYRDTAALSQEI